AYFRLIRRSRTRVNLSWPEPARTGQARAVLSSEGGAVRRPQTRPFPPPRAPAVDLALEILARYLSRYTYLGLFLILSVGGFGLPIPEEMVLIAAGLFVYQGVAELLPTLGACLAGMLIGDLLFFAVGRRYGRGALHGALRRLVHPERMDQVKG